MGTPSKIGTARLLRARDVAESKRKSDEPDECLTPTAPKRPTWHSCSCSASRSHGHNEAFRIPENGDWTSVTWKQTAERVEALAAGLLSLGVAAEDRIGIASSHPAASGSWPTWRSCAPVRRPPPSTRAPTPRTPPTSWPTRSSRIVFAEDDTQLKKLSERRSDLPNLTKVVVFDGDLRMATG